MPRSLDPLKLHHSSESLNLCSVYLLLPTPWSTWMLSRHPENMPPLITDMGFPGGPVVKNLPVNTGDSVSIPESRRSSGEETATHSSILAWRIPRTEEPGRLQSMGVTKVLDMTEQLTLSLSSLTKWYHIVDQVPILLCVIVRLSQFLWTTLWTERDMDLALSL